MRVAMIAGVCAAALVLGGCGGDDEETATTSAAASTESASAVPTLTVEGGQPVGGTQTLSADLGAPVVFDVTTDEADELHIHGYDKTVELPAGTPTRVEFTADIPGVFEIELHHAGTEIAQLRVGG